MKRRFRIVCASLLSAALAACGQNSGGTSNTTAGAANSMGGGATGGVTTSGGAATSSGGVATSGGSATGGSAASGAATGGALAAGGSAGSMTGGGALLPFKVGNSWTYQVTDGSEISAKTTTVEAMEVVGGSGPNKNVMAFRVVTKKGATGSDQTISWQAPAGDKVLRYREQAFGATTQMLKLEEHWDPYKLHVDGTAEHTLPGASWVETYVETKLPVEGPAASATNTDTWTVIAKSEMVSVPAGTFDAVVFEKSGSKRYWYARGVGKVKETGAQTEELTKFELAP